MRHARRDSMAGTNLAGTYQLGDCIGKGAFGSVYSGLNIETGEVVAIKQIRLANIPKSELGLIMSEIDLLKELNHPNIVKYTGFVKTKEHLNIVMEYCENGSLTSIYKKFGTFPEHLVAVYVGQVLDGLLYLHEQGVIHRDIKGANILTTKNGQVKLADFGIASKVDASNKAVVGSPYWMAPEVIELAGATTASDIWSVGCTTLELIEGRPPYHDLAPMSALFRIVQDDHPPIPEVTSKLLNDFLLECFQKDHNLRVSAKKLLKHPWIQNARKKVGAQASADVDREIERPRLKPAEDAWTKKHSPGFSGSTSSLASATSETVVNTISSLPPAPDAVRYRKAPVQSVVEIDLDDTNWEDDFEEGIAWPTVPKEPARPPSSTKSIPVPQSLPPSFTQPKATIIPVALPAPTPTAPSKPASEAAPLIQAQPTPRVDADEDTDIWDEDFEVPDTDVTIKLVKTASQPRLAVDSGHQQTLPQLANQAKTTNVLPTGKPVMINQYVEHPTTEEDDYSDLFGKEGGLPEPRRLSEVSSDLGIDSDEDDPFLSMIEDDSGEIGLKDKQAKLNGTVMELVRRLRPDQGAPVLIQTCDELVSIFKEHPETRRNLIIHHCVMPIAELLENTHDHNVLVRILKVINQSIENNLEIQENMCLLGGIPTIMSYANRSLHHDVRREAAIFVTQMCHASTLTLQMFISCRGLPVLVDMLDDDYATMKDLIWMAIDGVGCVFELQGPTPKNDFCRLFAKHNMLPILANVLHCINCDRDPRAIEISTKVVQLLLIFSQAEAPVKEALAARSCMEVLVQELHNLPPLQIVNMLKCMKNISMHSNTLEALDKAHLIEELCEFLDLRDSPFFSDIQNQVLNALFNLCRINKTRQEIAALAGLVPHLQRFVRVSNPLKQFALPLLCEMAHAGRVCRDILWQCDALSSYLALLSDAYWQVNALEAIFVWLSDDLARIGTTLSSPKQVETLMQTFITAKSTNFEAIVTSLQKLLAICPAISAGIAKPAFMSKLCEKIGEVTDVKEKAMVRLNLVRILSSVVESVGAESRKEIVDGFGVRELVEELAMDSAVLVKGEAQKLRSVI